MIGQTETFVIDTLKSGIKETGFLSLALQFLNNISGLEADHCSLQMPFLNLF